MEKVILKCLEREPEKRYHFMSMMTRDLRGGALRVDFTRRG